MRTIIIENTWLTRDMVNFGWGNGYVTIPPGHSFHGKDYNDIDVEVHGELTFASLADDLDWQEITEADKGSWVIGFDTAHAGDSLTNWPKESVQQEADLLLQQVKSASLE